MISNNIANRIYKFLSYALQNGRDKFNLKNNKDGFIKIDDILTRTNYSSSIDDIVYVCNNNDVFELIKKDNYYYVKYNSGNNINPKIKKKRIINSVDDILKLSPIYIMNIEKEKYYDIMISGKYDKDILINLYPNLKKINDNYLYLYIEWSHAYCNGVEFILNDDNSLSVKSSNINILFKHIYKIYDNDGNLLY